MINVVDILTAYKQGKCLNSEFPQLTCFLSLQMSDDTIQKSSVLFLFEGFCFTRALRYSLCMEPLSYKALPPPQAHFPASWLESRTADNPQRGQPGENLIQSSTQTWPRESGCTNEMLWFWNLHLELWCHPVDGRNRYKRRKCSHDIVFLSWWPLERPILGLPWWCSD